MHQPVRICVVGSINLYLAVRAERLPSPGEALIGGTFEVEMIIVVPSGGEQHRGIAEPGSPASRRPRDGMPPRSTIGPDCEK